MLVAGNPIRSDGKFAELCDQGDKDWLEQRPPHLSCRHFNVPSTASPHAHLDCSPWGMADKTWLEAVGRAPGKNSPWYRSHVEAIRPKLSHDTLIQHQWLELALTLSPRFEPGQFLLCFTLSARLTRRLRVEYNCFHCLQLQTESSSQPG